MATPRSVLLPPLVLALALLLASPDRADARGHYLTAPATLTPEQERSLADVRQMVKETVRVYKLYAAIDVKVVTWLGSSSLSELGDAGIVMTGTTIYLAKTVLDSPQRDTAMAVMLAHDILRAPSRAGSLAEYEREQVKEALDANAKAVEVLVRVRGRSERDALQAVYDLLLRTHRALAEGAKPAPGRKVAPCDQIRDLLARFPQHRDWTAGFDCAP